MTEETVKDWEKTDLIPIRVTPKKDWERGMRILSEGTHWVSWDWEEEEGLRKDDSDPEEEYPIMKIEEGEELRKT